MKKFLRILVPILLSLSIIGCSVWYFFVYDRDLTRDILLSCARRCEDNDNHNLATWFYKQAYAHDGNSDAVAIELAQQYIDNGNYTKAEYTLTNAISDGGGIDVYIKLCKTFIEQDKLYDAVNMLNNVANPEIKAKLNQLRPSAPILSPEGTTDTELANGKVYNEYITISVTSDNGKIYASSHNAYPSISSPYFEPFQTEDGDNIINAVTISDNGLISELSTGKYRIGDVVKEVIFVDSAIEAEVRTLLNVDNSKVLYTNNLWSITDFKIPAAAEKYDDLQNMIYLESLTIENGVADQLNFISKMSKLKSLTLVGTQISPSDMKVIDSISTLRELTLCDAGIASLSNFKNLKHLNILNISQNSINNIDAIGNMSELISLDISDNVITDLTPLSAITTLTYLNISGNQISTLAPIATLSELTELNASSNNLTELGNIGNLSKLTKLDLSKNQVAYLFNIEKCIAIEELNISENLLVDISALSSLIKLAHLNFSDNQVTALPVFSEKCMLVTINGSRNLLSSLEELSVLSQLNTVDMEGNIDIASIEPLDACPNLYRVNVLDTSVKDVRVLTNKSISVIYRHADIKT